MEREEIRKLLESVQTQIRTFDTKAQVALAINSALAGFLGNQIIKTAEYAQRTPAFYSIVVLSVGAFAFLSASFIWALLTIHPRLQLNQPKSHFFFLHIVEKYGRDFEAAANALSGLNDSDAQRQLATQVAVNSYICDIKAKHCRKALLATSIALALYLMSVLPFSVMAYKSGRQLKPTSCNCETVDRESNLKK